MDDSCRKVPQLDKQPKPEEQNHQSTMYLQIRGMNCNNCANRVRNALLSTYGVTSVMIELSDGLGEVRYNPKLASAEELVKAVRSAGGDGVHNYEARVLPAD